MKAVLICLEDECLTALPAGDGADGDECPNCDDGQLTQVVLVSLDDIEGRNGDYIAAAIRSALP